MVIISYGGSYPGARSAFLRILYPHLFHGSIASSAVTEAIESFPEYFYPIARGAPAACSAAIQAAVAGFDQYAVPAAQAESQQGSSASNGTAAGREALLSTFGVPGLTQMADLANLLVYPLGMYQSLNWNPEVSVTKRWLSFCSNMTSDTPASLALESAQASKGSGAPKLHKETYRLAAYLRNQVIDDCMQSQGPAGTAGAADSCFGTEDWSGYQQATDPNDIAWQFQTCQNWGYFAAAPPKPTSPGQPSYPQIVSDLITLEYSAAVCHKGFLPGKTYRLPAHPDTWEVNRHGGFNARAHRLAFIDGQSECAPAPDSLCRRSACSAPLTPLLPAFPTPS